MASIHKEISIEAAPEQVWDALRDIGAVHTRLAPGFVTNVVLEPGARVVTFGNGMVVRELIISVDQERRRVAWAARTEQLSHYSASAQVFAEGAARTRFVWIADLLPHAMEPAIAGMIDQGLAAIKRHLEQTAARTGS